MGDEDNFRSIISLLNLMHCPFLSNYIFAHACCIITQYNVPSRHFCGRGSLHLE